MLKFPLAKEAEGFIFRTGESMMEKEKVVFFLDYANINRAAREKRFRLDYHDMLHYVGEERFLIDAYCYVPINPRNEHRSDGVIEELWRSGYIVISKVGTIAGGTYKCNFDVEITMDVLKVVYQVKPDIIVLASGDSDFVSLVQDVRKSGVRVEVAAFEESAGADMMSKCSGFIDLAMYYDAYLAARDVKQDETRVDEQYTDLIQSQTDEQGKDGNADRDLFHSRESDLQADEVKVVDQADKVARVVAPDIIDETDL
jgi:uncharacterized LabA/DUF88 family protein